MRLWMLALAAACNPTTDADPDDGSDASCTYPQAAEPMAEGEPLAAYAWPEALRIAEGVMQPLDLARAYCNTDSQFDWSPHDYMLFVSVPAW